VHFYKTTEGRNSEAGDLRDKYGKKFVGASSPALIWISSDGKAVTGKFGYSAITRDMWSSLNGGLPSWWSN